MHTVRIVHTPTKTVTSRADLWILWCWPVYLLSKKTLGAYLVLLGHVQVWLVQVNSCAQGQLGEIKQTKTVGFRKKLCYSNEAWHHLIFSRECTNWVSCSLLAHVGLWQQVWRLKWTPSAHGKRQDNVCVSTVWHLRSQPKGLTASKNMAQVFGNWNMLSLGTNSSDSKRMSVDILMESKSKWL